MGIYGKLMAHSKKESPHNEHEVKISVGDWLTDQGLKVFDERKNIQRPQWGVFEVKNIERGKHPDLLVQGIITAAKISRSAYVAIELKRGYKHRDILDGFDAILQYFTDYMWGAEYIVDGEPIEISAFVLATFFSQYGYLFKGEGKFDPRNIVRGPWDSHPMTFTISRLLWRQKDNLLKQFRSLSGIPKIERKLSKQHKLSPIRVAPEVGVLIQDPINKSGVRLMLSKNPYHWRFDKV